MKAISSMATKAVLGALAEEAARSGHPRLDIESVGGVDAAERVRAGEDVDLVFLADSALRRLAEEGHVVPETVTPLVLSQVAVAVPGESDAAEVPAGPAFPDAEGLRSAVQAARRIGYSTGPSGTAFLDLLTAWGMIDDVRDRLVQARPGVPVAGLLRDREVDLGLQQLSELAGAPGVRILGTLPVDCAIDTVFSGAVSRSSQHPDDALGVLQSFASAASRPTIERLHFAQAG
ncbi:ABC transporter substrate-binding protein [Microbacterium oleivorans]|uniref:substrate-binding domain-containing protein n=1 Tax=Microbacterium oleivorans TaxID=273677 RepID=UPI0010A3C3C5|nr:substrate-binding domain-containing protein [Microbacterium oleivorans]THE07963.1 ABC transporter substrate-binding protein [Microbacterium oleivorans]